MQFKIGDVVKLKSGGPDMTVKEINTENRYITCVYFYNGDLRMAIIYPEVLKIDEKD